MNLGSLQLLHCVGVLEVLGKTELAELLLEAGCGQDDLLLRGVEALIDAVDEEVEQAGVVARTEAHELYQSQ